MEKESDINLERFSSAWWKKTGTAYFKPVVTGLARTCLHVLMCCMGVIAIGALYPRGITPVAEFDGFLSRYDGHIRWSLDVWIVVLEFYWVRGLVIIINLLIMIATPFAEAFNVLVSTVFTWFK